MASFATSYIPTTGIAATRAADIATITGDSFTRWYRQDEGTMYAESRLGGFAAGRFPNVFSVNDGTSNNSWTAYYLDYAIRFTYEVRSAGSSQVAFSQSGTKGGSVASKIASGLALNNTALSTDGVWQGADTSVALPVGVNRLQIPGGCDMVISRLTYWPRRLPDHILQELTR